MKITGNSENAAEVVTCRLAELPSVIEHAEKGTPHRRCSRVDIIGDKLRVTLLPIITKSNCKQVKG